MPKLSPKEAHDKWKNNVTNAIPYVKAGVMRVTESPMQKSADAEDKWFANIQKAHNSGKRKRALLNVSLDEWKDKTANIGADRISAGAAGAEKKQTAFYEKLFPFEEKLQTEVARMPNVSLQDSIARATKWITGMSQFDKTK